MTRRTFARRPSRGLLILASAALSAWLPSPALASDWQDVRERSFQHLAEAQVLIGNGRLEDAIGAAGALGGFEVPGGTLENADAPRTLDAAVAQLGEAVEAAGRVVVEASPPQLPPGARRDLTLQARDGDLSEGDFRRHGIDREAIAAAGVLLASTIEAALPALASHAAGLPAGAPAVGCDQLAQGPVCVGGTGVNTYEQDYALLIDLGGNDVHANSAGGADRVGNGLPVSVAIDLGGNDRYETAVPTKSGSRVAQGAGSSGIGILVDAGGSDTYAVTSTTPGTNVFAQGYSGIGLGILEDLEGNDSYRISYAPSRSPASRVQAQGFSSFGVAGLLLDRTGDDTYVAEATTPATIDDQGRVNPGRPLIQGMGYGEAGGVGIAADGGGTDSMTLRGSSAVVAAEESREVIPAGAYAEGFGFGTLGGTGLTLSGPGNTSRTISTYAEAPVVANTSAYGFGYGSTGGFAALADAGGDDSYTADTRAIAVRHERAGDACTCKSAGASADGGDAQFRGGGWGGAAVGILQDIGGNDRYALTTVSRTDAIAEDTHTVPASPAAQAYAVGGVSDIHGLGYGSVGGAGFLDDQAGNDVYDAQSISNVHASATASAPGASAVSVVEGGRAQTWSQAIGSTGGYGELRDGGGSDVYRAGADATATAEPATEASIAIPPETVSSVQGSAEVQPINGAEHPAGGFALLMDLDGGLADTFVAVPADPACTGTRGQGVWKDCGPLAGIGISS